MPKFIYFVLLLSMSTNAQSVYKTPSGKKYHVGNCRMVENVSEKISLTSAADLGLLPCKICNPQNFTALGLVSKKNNAQGETQTVKCKGRTKKGTQCKHKTSIANGYCFQHNPN